MNRRHWQQLDMIFKSALELAVVLDEADVKLQFRDVDAEAGPSKV